MHEVETGDGAVGAAAVSCAAELRGLDLGGTEIDARQHDELSSDGTDEEVDDTAAHEPTVARDQDGASVSARRNRRKLQTLNYPVIEAHFLEPADCDQAAGCGARLRCAAHGGTRCH